MMTAKSSPSAEVLARWEKDVGAMQQSIKLMLSNRVTDAEDLLEKASADIASRKIDWEGGDHDLRGGFAFVSAVFSLLNGLASLENDQLETVLTKTWAADELLQQDNDWPGRTVLRGICILVAGVVQVMQGSYAKGVWNVLRAWMYLRYLESEGLNFEGHERNCVRSTSLIGLGVFNLITSMLPPHYMRSASWLTGFTGGRDTALKQLRMCFDEGGITAPFAGLILIGFAVDISNFLGEFSAKRDERLQEAWSILEWSHQHHPDSFFFQAQEANYLAARRDLDGALEKIRYVGTLIQDKPALSFLVNVRSATLQACKFDWEGAAKSYRSSADVYRSVGRRAFCPTLLLNSHLCYVLAGDSEKAAEALELCRSYKQEKKKWSLMDADSLQHADRAHAATAQDASKDNNDSDSEPWRPKMLFYMKVAVLYRGANFMPLEDSGKFISMLKEETTQCGDDADARCQGLFLQAESMRQLESWDDALLLCAEGLALEPTMSAKGKKLGSLNFLYLVSSYAHYSKGNYTAAQDALRKLDELGSGSFFAKSVDFKATYVKELLGIEFKDTYRDLDINARCKSRLLVDVGTDTENVDVDWVVKDKTITFSGVFHKSEGGEPIHLHSLDHYDSSSGPFEFSFEVPGPGQLELLFDNSFSYLTGKAVQIRVQPSSLDIKEEANF